MLSSLFLVLLTLIFLEELVSEAHQKKGCPDRCGNMIIEYPLGIGPSCSRNDYFEVSCNGSSSGSNPKPILTKFNLQLLKLSSDSPYSGVVTVNIPVTEACADNNSFVKGSQHEIVSWSSLDLSGSPFYVSGNNVFASIGCDGLATLNNESGGVIGGCASICNPPNSSWALINGCHGYHCCQSDIHMINSYGLQVWRVKVSVSKVESCRTAFITSDTHDLNSRATILHSSVVVNPVDLSWRMKHHGDFNIVDGIGVVLRYIILVCMTTIPCTCGCFWACWYCKTKQRRKEIKLRAKYFKGRLEQSSSNGEEVIYVTKLFTIKELKNATDNFRSDRVIGQGGQGTVYKGMLANGQVIAVKRAKIFEETQWKQFINEVILLSQVNHRHVVKLLGCCLETKLPLLVYEFIPNGTLSQYIHNDTDKFLITWEMRVRIASEIAGAIAYLHSSSSTPIYHRDIKSANILLDDKFQAKVSDFGISKAVSIDQTHLTTCVQGTFGYLDPEYFRSSQFSEKSDVYSFGVILVELLTGQQPIRVTTSEEERSLVMYFISAMTESIMNEILDPLVVETSAKEEVMLVANLAKQCLDPRGALRPTMKEVAMELEGLRKKSSSATSMRQQVSQETEHVISIPMTLDMDNAYTTSAILDRVSISSHGNCGDE